MLDVLVKRNDAGRLAFSVYRKPTHTDHYLQYTSHQPLEHKLGVMRTLRHRAAKVVTSPDDQQEKETHIKEALTVAGYPKWAWSLPVAGGKKKKDKEKRPIKSHVTVPYVQGVSELLT